MEETNRRNGQGYKSQHSKRINSSSSFTYIEMWQPGVPIVPAGIMVIIDTNERPGAFITISSIRWESIIVLLITRTHVLHELDILLICQLMMPSFLCVLDLSCLTRPRRNMQPIARTIASVELRIVAAVNVWRIYRSDRVRGTCVRPQDMLLLPG